jgi:hypothetical protein
MGDASKMSVSQKKRAKKQRKKQGKQLQDTLLVRYAYARACMFVCILQQAVARHATGTFRSRTRVLCIFSHHVRNYFSDTFCFLLSFLQGALKDGSHADAVMCVGWNSAMPHLLASGSADKTVVSVVASFLVVSFSCSFFSTFFLSLISLVVKCSHASHV